MTKTKEIRIFCDELVRVFKPDRIVLFGSYAEGRARDDSDVDLLVAMDHKKSGPETAAMMIEQLKPRFAVDLIVKSEREIKRRMEQEDFFLQQVMREGKVLYEASHP